MREPRELRRGRPAPLADLPERKAGREQDQPADQEEEGGVDQPLEGLGIDIEGLQDEADHAADARQAGVLACPDQDQRGEGTIKQTADNHAQDERRFNRRGLAQ